MFAVIFKAIAGSQDKEYQKAVLRMRELAFSKYGCLDFLAVTEGKQEVAISYWESQEAISSWKNDSEHLLAQELGRSKWYESYVVQVVEVMREYEFRG